MRTVHRKFESSVNSYDSQTEFITDINSVEFESSVNSYDSQTHTIPCTLFTSFESSVNSYDSQTQNPLSVLLYCLRVV